ncbi:small GTP-binding protein [Clostridium botulinum A3 str. Loch Maree]|nr:small GTP-binding protein [Clostridium botulinum A3 str. Loch Maree]
MILLFTIRAHNKHTSGENFKEAAFRALRQITFDGYYIKLINIE